MDFVLAVLLAWIAVMATIAVKHMAAIVHSQRQILDVSGMVHRNTYETKSQLASLNHRMKRNAAEEPPAEELKKERLRSIAT